MKQSFWYQGTGEESDVAVSARIRFARNLEGYPFPNRMENDKAQELITKVTTALGSSFTGIDFSELSPTQAAAYVERHLASPDFVRNDKPHTLAISEDGACTVMIGEEDHIRLQCILPGMALTEAYRRACTVDDMLAKSLPIAYDEKLGYLTCCPTNLGSGMRASVMLFLPALQTTDRLASLASQLPKLGLTIRGLYGEGSEGQGALYQVSNQITLGIPEQEIIAKLEEVIHQIINLERKARATLRSDHDEAFQDKIMRSYGIMHYAHMMSSAEFLKLFSDVRLGISLGLIRDCSLEKLGQLMIDVMPGNLSLLKGHDTDDTERDIYRAETVRNRVCQST